MGPGRSLTLDSAIHRIKIYPVANAIGFPNTYSLDSDLSGNLRSGVILFLLLCFFG